MVEIQIPPPLANLLIFNKLDNYFYSPITYYNNSDVLGCRSDKSTDMDAVAVSGSSANAIAVDGQTLYVRLLSNKY